MDQLRAIELAGSLAGRDEDAHKPIMTGRRRLSLEERMAEC